MRRHRDRHQRGRRHRNDEPWGWQKRFFEPGEVRLALLSLLAEEPMHGYQLMKAIEDRSGGTYKASAGTVYPNLQQLEDEGLVNSHRDGGRRVYSLTAEGRRVVEEESDTVDRIWERADTWDDWGDVLLPTAAELLGPVSRLIKATVKAGGRSRGDRDRVERIRGVINKAIDEIEALERL